MQKEKIPIKCDKCGNEWNTKSKAIFVSCPSCTSKTKNPIHKDYEGIRNRDKIK